MTYQLLFNGEFYAEPAKLISPSDSGFRYGHGLFETIRVQNNRPHLASYHFERLFNGMEVLGFERPAGFSNNFLLSQINHLLTKNVLSDAKVRLTISGNTNSMAGSSSTFDWIIQSYSLAESYFQFNKEGLKIGICYDVNKSNDVLCNLKSGNYLPMLFAARQSLKQGLDDSIILNHAGNIVESSISNVFVVKRGRIYTPPLVDGPVAGVMRRHILEILPSLNIEVREESITIDQLKEADEVFLSNALSGIRWVKKIRDIQYSNLTSSRLYPKLFE